MIIVEPSATLEWITPNAAEVIERAGRTCYLSSHKIEPGSAAKFIKMIMKNQHLSVLEHASASIRFVTDRAISHELVRHRLCSFSEASTRYCNYSKDRFGGEIQVIEPPFKHRANRNLWKSAVLKAEDAYMALLANDELPQIARSVLPNCLKTEIVTTCNFRQWLLIFSLRSDENSRAHPQIREIMNQAKVVLQAECPEVFGVKEGTE